MPIMAVIGSAASVAGTKDIWLFLLFSIQCSTVSSMQSQLGYISPVTLVMIFITMIIMIRGIIMPIMAVIGSAVVSAARTAGTNEDC